MARHVLPTLSRHDLSYEVTDFAGCPSQKAVSGHLVEHRRLQVCRDTT